MMKKIVCIMLCVIVWNSAHTQSNIRLNNFWENFYYITPAAISKQYAAVFSLATRKQWVDFSGAPTTFFASGTVYLDNLQTQFGIKAFKDQIGYTTSTNVALSYAYAAMLSENWRIHLGIAGSYQTLSYDMSKIILATKNDPGVYTNLRRENNFNSDLGVELANKSFRIGAASQNVASLVDKKNNLQVNTNFLYATYRDYAENPINLSVGACGIQYSNLYQMECTLTAYFQSAQQTDLFHIGVLYRTPGEIGGIFGINISNSFYLSYSYDYNFNPINRSSTGSHELMLIYKLKRAPYCPSCF
jgi:type IX secretion system PorP/SprF family membrane protein